MSVEHRITRATRLPAVFLTLAAMVFSAFPVRSQSARSNVHRLSEDQTVLHVLNRLGFGARPGDVERVKAIGVKVYIEQQLNPESINDDVATAKLSNLATLKMTTAELYQKYPQPGRLLRQLERRGELPADLAAARENRVKGGAANPDIAKEQAANGMEMRPETPAPQTGDGNPMEQQKYRRALREYYAENGLQLPQRIIAELQASRILRSVYSERQLQEVMVDFWTNHFNVFAGKGADRWLLISYDRDTIRPNALGKFSNLLVATAQSPAMLFYLDNFQSVSPNAQLGQGNGQRRAMRRGLLTVPMENGTNNRQVLMSNNPEQQRPQTQARRGINENYARELMELHTLGVDGGYTQKDVQEVARCFTGWTIIAPRGAGVQGMSGPRADMLRENAGRYFFNARAHDDGEKIVLGHKIPAGGGFKDGLIVLDILARHQSTAKFVAGKLVRHFVSDTPPPGLVEQVAAAFTKSGGDIRETLRAIFYSPEFNSPEVYRAKVKRPFELTISAIRALGGETNGSPQLHQWIARMGEPLYGFQTPNGYSDGAESWVNTGALLERLNFGLTLASNNIPGTTIDLKRFVGPQQAADKAKTMERFLSLIVAGDISPKTKETLLKQVKDQGPMVVPALKPDNAGSAERMGAAMPGQGGRRLQLARSEANITDPVTKMVGLILGSPEFQRQ